MRRGGQLFAACAHADSDADALSVAYPIGEPDAHRLPHAYAHACT